MKWNFTCGTKLPFIFEKFSPVKGVVPFYQITIFLLVLVRKQRDRASTLFQRVWSINLAGYLFLYSLIILKYSVLSP